jgi:hypothetical protein
MKPLREFKKIGIIIALFTNTLILKGQASFVGHGGAVPATDWCGWNAASLIPFDIQHRGNLPIRFFTSAAASERVRIFPNGVSPSAPNGGGLAINSSPGLPIISPMSLLHIGNGLGRLNGIIGVAGWRSWMSVGTYMGAGDDNMYVGIKNEGTLDRQDAIIDWGDNNAGPPISAPDYLRFVFTADYVAGAPGIASSFDGMEIMRCSPFGRVGIGNFYNNPQFPVNDPARRLEILSDRTLPNNAGNPQLRLTNVQQLTNGNPNLSGVFTDFHATNFGDLNINPRDNSLPGAPGSLFRDRFVGIHVQNPGNTLEINSQMATPTAASVPGVPGSWPGSQGASGLRFSDLTSASAVVPVGSYPGAGIIPTQVLTVDGQGNVVKILSTPNVQANNGISVSNNIIQLGATCNSNTVALANLVSTRSIPLNGFHVIFSENIGASGRVGIGKNIGCAPGNQLEVNNGIGGTTSGLRLTDLAGQNGAPPINNNVLSVNPSGDVILTTVPVNPGTGIGNYCNGNPNPLTLGDYEIPLNTFNYRFTGQAVITPAVQQDVVSIGYNCFVPRPVSKFSVLEAQTVPTVPFTNYAGHFRNKNVNQANASSIIAGGVYGEVMSTVLFGGNQFIPLNIGGVFQGAGAAGNIGVLGRNAGLTTPTLNAAFGPFNIGGAFMSDSATSNYVNYGVYAVARNSTKVNFGVYGEVDAGNPSPNYAIFGRAFPGGVGSKYAGYFDGDVVKTGNDNFTSDQILKQNINPLSNGLSIINQLQPKTFDYQTNTFPQMNLPVGLQYGLIAQDVQTVVPALVNTVTHPPSDVNGQYYAAQNYLTLEYTQLIPILVKAVQELSAQNQSLVTQMQSLTQVINSCCENQQARQTGVQGNDLNAQQQIVNQYNVDLSDKDVIVLNQNVPNPYAENTVITYNVPMQYKFAQIIFKTVDGKIIKAVDIDKKGRGQLNVFGSDLSNGLYMYTLIVDGKEIDAKKMVKQN